MSIGFWGRFGRRALAKGAVGVAATMALASCGPGDGPPGSDDVRAAVVGHLEALRTRFLGGDEAAVPPDVADRIAGADMSRLRESVRRAELASFSGGRFERTAEGNWKGPVRFEVAIPSPVSALSLSFLVSGEATMRVIRRKWAFVAFGPLGIQRAADSSRT